LVAHRARREGRRPRPAPAAGGRRRTPPPRRDRPRGRRRRTRPPRRARLAHPARHHAPARPGAGRLPHRPREPEPPLTDQPTPAPLPVAEVATLGGDVLREVGTAVVGMAQPLRLALAAVLAGGHVLFEDVRGLGKTLAAR